MHKVEVMIKRCGCFTKSGMSECVDFRSKEEAAREAAKLVWKMNSDFCGKHTFEVIEIAGNFKIVEAQ